MTKQPKVLCSGHIALDYYGPAPKETLGRHFSNSAAINQAADNNWLMLGGKGMNFAHALACAGIETWMHGTVGNDLLGDIALQMATQCGVNVTLVGKSEDPTLLFAVEPELKTLPTKIHERHASTRLPTQNLSATFLAECACVITHATNAWDDLVELCAKTKATETLLIMSPSPVYNLVGTQPLLAADYIIANRLEAETILARSGVNEMGTNNRYALAERLHDHFGKVAIVTLDADGVVACDAEGSWYNAVRPSEIVDTVGAGDAFLGYAVASLLRGNDLPVALRIGQTAAGLICEQEGATIPGLSLAAILEHIHTTPEATPLTEVPELPRALNKYPGGLHYV